jgi:flagellar biosynthesis protein FliQ
MGRTACTEPQCLYKGALYLFYLYLTNCMQPSPSSKKNTSRSSGSWEIIRILWYQNLHHSIQTASHLFFWTTLIQSSPFNLISLRFILLISYLRFCVSEGLFILVFVPKLSLFLCYLLYTCPFFPFFPVALRPNAGHGLNLDVSRSHTTTHHSR